MGSDDGDNGAVTLDQADMLPQGRRVIGFACEAGEGGPGQREETQDLGNKQRPHHTFQFDQIIIIIIIIMNSGQEAECTSL